MIISFSELKNYSFLLNEISVLRQHPAYHAFSTNSRLKNGFIYIESGVCHYTFAGGEFDLSPGAIVYLPVGSAHHLQILSNDIVFYRIDFTLSIDGEVALFSDVPLKITDAAAEECVVAIKTLCSNYSMLDDSIRRVEQMCIILRSLSAANSVTVGNRAERIRPALEYIRAHLTEPINCRNLSSLCYLGNAQFYSIFTSVTNETPLAYRNRLLIDRAKQLLSLGDISITEASTQLGFESAAYFSRFFKKHVGVSPSEYVRRLK